MRIYFFLAVFLVGMINLLLAGRTVISDKEIIEKLT
jgi:hypothetical protein